MRLTLTIVAALALALPAAYAQPDPPARVYLPLIEAAAFVDSDLAALVEASRGLSYPSESDYSFAPFAWRAPAGSPAAVCKELAEGQGRPVEQRSLEQLFARLTVAGPGAGDEERAVAARYADLYSLAAGLGDGIVCRVGLIKIDVYIMGVSRQGQIVGLRTVAIET